MLCSFVQGLFLIFLIDFALVENASAYQRFVEIPTGSNGTILADLEAPPNSALLKTLQKAGDINRYLLFTRKNPSLPQKLLLDDEVSIRSSNFDSNKNTAILIHGWQSQTFMGLDVIVKKALLNSEDVNVIVLDWRIISSLDYVTAVAGVPRVGENLGVFLEYLNFITGASYSSMHLIGHSLGAHIAGNAGRRLNGQVARLTGLDPAGPIWYFNPKRLNPSDALYVEAIHTNGAGLGIERNVADVDFYPNGGSLQPGCLAIPVCNHGRSYELFASSIDFPNRLVGKRCANLAQMTFNLCKGSELPLGSNDLRKRGSGIYRLNTGSKYPY